MAKTKIQIAKELKEIKEANNELTDKMMEGKRTISDLLKKLEVKSIEVIELGDIRSALQSSLDRVLLTNMYLEKRINADARYIKEMVEIYSHELPPPKKGEEE